MSITSTRSEAQSRDRKREAGAVERQLRRAFTPEVVDKLRADTGYNPHQRVGTALRLMLTVVEAFLVGQTLSFTSLRAIFVRRFGFVRPCPFQKRFKQASAAAFFRGALERLNFDRRLGGVARARSSCCGSASVRLRESA